MRCRVAGFRTRKVSVVNLWTAVAVRTAASSATAYLSSRHASEVARLFTSDVMVRRVAGTVFAIVVRRRNDQASSALSMYSGYVSTCGGADPLLIIDVLAWFRGWLEARKGNAVVCKAVVTPKEGGAPRGLKTRIIRLFSTFLAICFALLERFEFLLV